MKQKHMEGIAAAVIVGDDEFTATFNYYDATPERGRFGPPEGYDPGEPAKLELLSVKDVCGRCVMNTLTPEQHSEVVSQCEQVAHDYLREVTHSFHEYEV